MLTMVHDSSFRWLLIGNVSAIFGTTIQDNLRREFMLQNVSVELKVLAATGMSTTQV